MQLELNQMEVALLLRHLEADLEDLETEVDPTDQPDVQQRLLLEIEALRAVCERLKADPQATLPIIA
ncbi:MAG TPA: hypothetical protein VIF09_22775 [Polyangiaceae bacterium]|jgi:hypothetical protein